eukprot:SAG31_NODE_3089_length_4688_cov_4.310961_6_plen_89_part_00
MQDLPAQLRTFNFTKSPGTMDSCTKFKFSTVQLPVYIATKFSKAAMGDARTCPAAAYQWEFFEAVYAQNLTATYDNTYMYANFCQHNQ